VDEVEMSNVHASATVALQTHFIEGFSVGLAVRQQLLEIFPLVGDHAATTETSYWNNHVFTSSVRLLLLAASATAELVLGLLSAWVVHEKAAVEAQVLVSEFFVNALSATVVVDKTTSDGGADGIGLTHDAATVGGDSDVDLAESVHGVGDDQGFHRLAASQGRLQNFDGFGVDTDTSFASLHGGTSDGGLSLS
jgi:hypothetical protein